MKTPEWFIGDEKLTVSANIKYLGTILDNNRGLSHVNLPASKANRAFYSLQEAGFYHNTVSPKAAIYVYNTAVRSELLYGCSAINISKTNLNTLGKVQSKHIRTILGLNVKTHISKLLQALEIDTLTQSVEIGSLSLLKSCLCSSSVAKYFYSYVMK